MTEAMDKLQAMADKLMGFGETIFNEHGPDYLTPMWHGQSESEPDLIIVTPYVPGVKDEISNLLKAKFRAAGVIRAGHLTEAWLRIAGPEDVGIDRNVLDGNVSAHPDRREVMLVMCEDKAGNVIQLIRYILRPEHGKPCLMPVEATMSGLLDSKEMTGRFTHMLAD